MATDAFELALVHEAFRSELHNAVELARHVAAGDTPRAATVGSHIEFMLTALHHHHKAEDDVIWPKLLARAGAGGIDVVRMAETHDLIAADIARVSGAVKVWVAAADSESAERLLAALEQLCGRLDDHLADEEQTVVPLINAHLTDKEWRQFLARGGRFLFVHPKLGLVLAGFVLNPLSAEDRKRFLGNVPLPQRAAFQLLGMRTFTGYRAKLYQLTEA
jgi:iron-sulfur cluster repair protein YtfE (RIC family)